MKCDLLSFKIYRFRTILTPKGREYTPHTGDLDIGAKRHSAMILRPLGAARDHRTLDEHTHREPVHFHYLDWMLSANRSRRSCSSVPWYG